MARVRAARGPLDSSLDTVPAAVRGITMAIALKGDVRRGTGWTPPLVSCQGPVGLLSLLHPISRVRRRRRGPIFVCTSVGMVDVVDPNVFETANAGFAQAMYEEFLRDPASVGPEWRRMFEAGVVGERPEALNGAGASGDGGPAGTASAETAPRPAPATGGSPGGQAEPPPGATPIKGPAAKLVANMTESLTVPTATTFRVVPVGVLEERRRRLNQALQAAGRQGKISFTHLIAFALVQATKQHPVMGHTLVLRDGTPYRVQPEGIALGLAVDVQRKDGSRGLVVPVIKRAETHGLRRLPRGLRVAGGEGAHQPPHARRFRRAPPCRSPIPAGSARSASVPRLMAGQGSIIAVGAIGYPAEFAAVPEERLREFGISKVMTVTSTYDHRVIQGAESGSFLATRRPPAPGRAGLLRADRGEPASRRGELPARRRRRRPPSGRRRRGRSRPRCCTTWPRPWRW